MIRDPKNNPKLGYLLVTAGSLSYAIEGVLITEINQRYNISTPTIVFYRQWAVTLVLIGSLAVLRPSLLRVRWRDLPFLIGMGLLVDGIGNLAYTQAILTAGISVTTVLVHTSPVWVNLFAFLVWRDKLGLPRLAALVGSFLGILFVAGVIPHGPIQLNGSGVLLGLLTSLTAASFFLLGTYAVKRYSPITVITYIFGSAAVGLTFIQSPALVTAVFRTPNAFIWILALGLGPGLLGSLGWIAGTQYLPAGVSSLVAASMEPVLASSVAWILLDERLNLYQILGAFITIACVVMLGYFDLKQERKVIKGIRDDLPQRW